MCRGKEDGVGGPSKLELERAKERERLSWKAYVGRQTALQRDCHGKLTYVGELDMSLDMAIVR